MVKQSYENKGFRDLKEINLPLDIHGKYGVLREYEGRKVGVKDGSEQIILRGFIRLNKDEEMYYLILDKGGLDGVQEGMAVITPGQAAVGRIEEVFKTTSRVVLLSHSASSFDAKIVREGVVGLVQGKGGYEASLDLIPQESRVMPGDIVVSASLGGIFPEDLLVGEVQEVKAGNEKSFQQASLSLFFDMREAGLLFIINDK